MNSKNLIDDSKGFSSFSILDKEETKKFYREKLGLEVNEEEMGLLSLSIGEDEKIMLYPKADHEPASYTVLNFPVDDIDKTVHELIQKGIVFEHYPGTDEEGIYHGDGPLIAWFKDPSGNILSVLQD